jgi:hypothetical protein
VRCQDSLNLRLVHRGIRAVDHQDVNKFGDVGKAFAIVVGYRDRTITTQRVNRVARSTNVILSWRKPLNVVPIARPQGRRSLTDIADVHDEPTGDSGRRMHLLGPLPGLCARGIGNRQRPESQVYRGNDAGN